jgi:gamma-glutamyltranspeptidase/glutathione hydrolase
MRDIMKPTIIVAASGLAVAFSTLSAQDRSQSRSMVMSQSGIVATESVLASQVGARVLENGGNAVDAAVAANAMMGLVAPMNDGVGGDLFAMIYEATSGKLYGLNASGWAPRRLTPDFLAAKGITEMPQSGIHSVTVPGAVEGYRLRRRGISRRGSCRRLLARQRESTQGR